MKVGIEGNHTFGFKTKGIFKTLEFAKEIGSDGVMVKTALDISPTLDGGELREAKALADNLGLFLQCGIGRVNPYNTSESPEIRILGGGDYNFGVERLIRAARLIDCVELLAYTATTADKPNYPGIFATDRGRSDVSWSDQLVAIEKFLKSFRPILSDLGCRIDIETHEEITSFEVVRLVEALGADVYGITFDTGNIVLRGESPIAAARRVAPYTHLTHIKDVLLLFDQDGLFRMVPPCGQGIVDWKVVLSTLQEYSPDLHLTIEDHKGIGRIPIYHHDWLEMHPDLTGFELAQLVQLAKICENRIAQKEYPDPFSYESIPFETQWLERLQGSLKFLKIILDEIAYHEKHTNNLQLANTDNAA